MRDRIRVMASIARIRDHALQQKSADLANMQKDLARVREIREDIRQASIEGFDAESPEAMSYSANFLRRIAKDEARAEDAERKISSMIDNQRDEVMAAWRGLTSINRLKEAAVDTLKRAQDAVEASGNDERSIIAHARSIRRA